MPRFIPTTKEQSFKPVPKVGKVKAIPNKKTNPTPKGSDDGFYALSKQLESIKDDKAQLLKIVAGAEKSYGVNFFISPLLEKLELPVKDKVSELTTNELYTLVKFICETVVTKEPAESNISKYDDLSLTDRLNLMFYVRNDDPVVKGIGERPMYIKSFSLGCNDHDEMMGYLYLLNAADEFGIKVAAPRTSIRKARTAYEYEIKGWVRSLKWKEAKAYLEELASLVGGAG